MQSSGGRRPGNWAPRSEGEEKKREGLRREAEPPLGEEVLAYRYEWGLDLWTGLPLRGLDAKDWNRVKCYMREVTQTRDDGEYEKEG